MSIDIPSVAEGNELLKARDHFRKDHCIRRLMGVKPEMSADQIADIEHKYIQSALKNLRDSRKGGAK